jgi:hypothetical protein
MAKKKPTRKITRVSKSAGRSKRSRAELGAGQVIRDFRRFEKAVAATQVRTTQLQASLEEAISLAQSRERTRLLLSLNDGQMLEYLQQLAAALAALDKDSLPHALRPYRGLPDTLLEWVRDELGATPWLRAGDCLDLDDRDLGNVRLLPRGVAVIPPVGVVVQSSGWRIRGRLVIKPTVTTVAPVESNEGRSDTDC